MVIDKDLLKVIGVSAVVISSLILICSIPDRISCHVRWSGSGYDTEYSLLGGCRVQIDGKWMPEDAIRKIDP